MGEVELGVLLHIITFLAFPFVGGYIATRFKLPPLLGYIIGGVVMGLFVEKTVSGEFLSQFAGLGIILLLFTVGLEINLQSLNKLKKFVLIGGALQIVSCGFFIGLLSLGFRFSFVESVLIGFSFSLSSTAVIAKIIQERGEENSLVGALALGMLVFQDLAAIPFIIILSGLSPDKVGASLFVSLIAGIAKAVIVLVLVYFIGQKLVPIIFKKTAAVSRELLNLFTILFIFSIVTLFSYLGLSPSIAAFLAGVLVGQTLEHYHIFSQIRPLRDLFTILFFVYLGASVNLPTVIAKLPLILLFTSIVILIKCVLIICIFIRFKFHSRTSFSIAILLSQVGEFAFILLNQAFVLRVISEE
jgi:CPA2 family monovalent cation:H+ antiporter-2